MDRNNATSTQEGSMLDIKIDGLTEKETQEVYETFQRFLKKYKADPKRETVEWLSEQIAEELPHKEKREIHKFAEEISEAIDQYGQDLADLNESCKLGMTKESWLAEKIQDGAKGMAVYQFGDHLREVDRCMAQANQQMARTILRTDGGVSQNVNLDGFIAEQHHVNQFNARAVIEGSPYRARVCMPEKGHYGKNSVDVMIDDLRTGQKGVARYQMKYGKDSQATADLLKHGDYGNQRLVVPKEQLEEIRDRFPGRSVTDCIGGTEEIPIYSDGLEKSQIKELQKKAQDHGVTPKTDWNSYQTKELALNIGKQAGQAGIHAAFLGTGINLAKNVMSSEPIGADEVVENALVTGADASVKAAAGGALKVVSEKELISLLPPGTQAAVITKIACVGIENTKILLKVAKGDMTMSEAMEHMGRTSVSMYAGLSAGAIGAGIGAAALSWIPVVGTVVGGVIGGIAGYTAGNKVGEKIFESAKRAVETGVKAVKKVVESVKNIVSNIADAVFNWLPF